MSAPLRLTAADTSRLAGALSGLTEIAKKHNVRFDAYSALDVSVTNQTTISVRWDEDEGYSGEYVVDDRNGS